MSTSLAAQLRAIASIDADRLTSHHGTPAGKSYLFTPAVAASHDAAAIYHIAQTGFEELLGVDPALEQFEEELFSPASRGTDRMMLTREENERLGRTIDACLRKLGKWITLKATSKCLEWLIRRFRVHELNAAALLEAFLPYHDSPYFPRILAITTLTKSLPLHDICRPLQTSRTATPLDRTRLVRGMLPAQDPSLALLRMVLRVLPTAARSGDVHPTTLTWWTATLVDFLERVRQDRVERSEELARVLTEGLLECLAVAQENEEVRTATLPALLLFVRSFSLSAAPFSALLSASALPESAMRGATAALALLGSAPEDWTPVMPSAWAEAVQETAFCDAALEMAGRAGARRGLGRLIAAMLSSPGTYHSSLLHLLNAQQVDQAIVQSAVDGLGKTVAHGKADDRDAAREILGALAQRHGVNVNASVIGVSKKRSKHAARLASGLGAAFADVYDVNAGQRAKGIAALYASVGDVPELSAEATQSARDAILARLADDEDRVIDALYADTSALFRLLSPADLLAALWPVLSEPDANGRAARHAHVKHLKALGDSVFTGPTLQFELFRVAYFPLLLRTHYEKEGNELVLQNNAFATAPQHDVLKGAAFEGDYWARIATNIIASDNQQDYVNFLLAQSVSNTPKLALAAHLLLTQVMLKATPELRLALAPAILETAASDLTQSFDSLDPADAEHLDARRQMSLKGLIFGNSSIPTTRILTAEALLMTLTQVNAPDKMAWLAETQAPVQEGYRAFAIGLYAAANSLRISSETATSLLRSLLWRLGEGALAFFAAVWTHPDTAATTQYAALQHSAAFVRAFDQTAARDFQCVVPGILVALRSANKQVRAAGVALLQAMLDQWVASPKDIYGAKDLYGPLSSSVRLLRASDYKLYLQQLVGHKQDIMVAADAINEVHRQMLDAGSRVSEDAGAKWRKHVLTFLASHLLAWRSDIARMALIGLFGSSMDKAKLQALQLYTVTLSQPPKGSLRAERKWLERLSQADLSMFLGMLFAPMDKSAARYIVRDAPDLLSTYQQMVRGIPETVSGRALRAAVIEQMQRGPFVQMSIMQQADFVEAMLAIDIGEQEYLNGTRQALQSIPFSSSLTVEVIRRLQANVETSEPANVPKRPRTEDASASDSWTSLMTFLESRAAAEDCGDESVLVACNEVLSGLLSSASGLDVAASNHLQQVVLRWMTKIAESIKANQSAVTQPIGVEVIVKLIRGSPNPRTAQDALLLLGSLASFSPDAVLHNIMPVFTYMGSDEMQRDDAHSIAVVEKTIESIVPVLLDTHRRQGVTGVELAIRSTDLLQIFADMAQRLPKHRAVPFFVHLVRVMGADVFLGPIEMLLVQRFVQLARLSASKAAGGFSSSLPFLLESQFDTAERLTALSMIVREIEALRQADGDAREDNSFFASDRRPGIETAEARLALNKQLTSFVNKVLQSITPTTDQRGVLRNIAETLATEAARRPAGRISKQEQAIEEQLAQAASSALNLLPAQDMADVCITLTTQHQSTRDLARRVLLERLPTVRRDIRELISPRLVDLLDHYASIAANISAAELAGLLPMLLAVAKPALAAEDAAFSRFVPVLLGRFGKDGDPQLDAEILAYLAEMPKRLGPRLIPHLKKLFALCLVQCGTDTTPGRPAMAASALKVAAAVIAHLPGFLPQADLSALVLTCVKRTAVDLADADSVLAAVAKHVKGQTAFSMLFDVWAKLREQNISHLQRFFKLLQRTIRATDRAVLPVVMKPLFNLYLEAFDIAAPTAGGSTSGPAILDAAIDSFVDLVVKLNEATFKPLLGRLHDWAIVEDAGKTSIARHATLYRILERLLHKFQAIMLPYLSLVELDMISLLKAYQQGEQSGGNLWLAMIALLATSFGVRAGNFWTTEKLTAIIPVLADQVQVVSRIDEPMDVAVAGLVDMFVSLAQLASSSEALLKSLNMAILLETRADETATRLVALSCLKAIWQKNGEDMIGLVPETVAQFLSELMEDEHSDVEKVAREVLTVIEGYVGDLQGYLT